MDQSSVSLGAETLKKREREQDDEEEIDEAEQKKLDDAFLDACANGTLDDVKRTLRAGASNNAQNRNGDTGLNLVVQREEQEDVFEIAKFLLSRRCLPSVTNERGQNAVHLAAEFASPDVMKLLLAKDRHLALLPDRYGWTPLGNVCYNAEERVAEEAVEIARLLLDAGADIEQGIPGSTPLLIACETCRPELVSFLLQRGANAEAADDEGWTCLHCACRNGAFGREIIPLLVKAGADVTEKTSSGHDALSVALAKSNAMAETLLQYHPQGSKPSHKVSSSKDPIGCIKMQVQLGSEVEDFLHGGPSEVHWAMLRNGRRLRLDGSVIDVFNQLSKSTSDYLWIWASREPCFQQHPTTGDTVLHLLARPVKLSSDHKMKVFAALKKDFRNPLIPNFQNKRAIDLTSDPVLKAELAKYMEWQPSRWAMHWFGPVFRERAFALLLVLKRYPRVYIKDIRYLLLKYLARVEHIYVPSKV